MFRMPIIDRVKDMGAVVMGKVESGTVRVGDSLLLMPNKVVYLFILWVAVSLFNMKWVKIVYELAGSSESCCHIY